MASKQKMNMNKHLRSRAGQPVETESRSKRNRKRNYTNHVVKNENGKLTYPVRDGSI